MKLIPLTKGLSTVVDDDVYEWASKFKWFAGRYGNYVYAVRNKNTPDGQRQIRLHRAIVCPVPGLVVDHINGDTLDNRRENLRSATATENKRNQKARGKGRLKGVCYRQRNSKKPWNANFWDGKKFKSLGYYETELMAHEAYIKEAQKRHGQFFRAN